MPAPVADSFADYLERRWFAANSACAAQRRECESLRQSLENMERAWSHAHARLRQLESLRDTLGQELAQSDAEYDRAVVQTPRRMSIVA